LDSLYFVAMIVGIAWLALWTALPDGLPFVSPFDVAATDTSKSAAEAQPVPKKPVVARIAEAVASRPASARTNAAASWRQRMQPRRVDVAAAEAAAGQPERRPVASWRTRRDLPSGSRRRR